MWHCWKFLCEGDDDSPPSLPLKKIIVSPLSPHLFPGTFYSKMFPLMSTPDALPMEIALIALLLFKLQVYSTFLHHQYHRLITLSIFQLLHQSTLHHMVSINTLWLPIKKFFLSTRLVSYTHSTVSHSLSYPEFNCNNFFSLLSVSLSLFSPQLHASRVVGPTYGNIAAITNLQVQLWNRPRRNCGDLYYQLHPW
jgi:hypothetical protein